VKNSFSALRAEAGFANTNITERKKEERNTCAIIGFGY